MSREKMRWPRKPAPLGSWGANQRSQRYRRWVISLTPLAGIDPGELQIVRYHRSRGIGLYGDLDNAGNCWNTPQGSSRTPTESKGTQEHSHSLRLSGPLCPQDCVLEPTHEGIVEKVYPIRVAAQAVQDTLRCPGESQEQRYEREAGCGARQSETEACDR